MTAIKITPRKPEPLILADEDEDNIFFALHLEDNFEENAASVELALVVDVKGDGDEDSMEYLYSALLSPEVLYDLKAWLTKAFRYSEHVEEHGIPFPLILGE